MEVEHDQQPAPPTTDSGSDALQSRIDAVFGSLGGTAAVAGASWSLSHSEVVRPGRQKLDSSDEEEEQREYEREQAECGVAQAMEEWDPGAGNQASVAFCKALDREEEYDDADEMAVGLRAEARDRSCSAEGRMEAYDDTVYEDDQDDRPPCSSLPASTVAPSAAGLARVARSAARMAAAGGRDDEPMGASPTSPQPAAAAAAAPQGAEAMAVAPPQPQTGAGAAPPPALPPHAPVVCGGPTAAGGATGGQPSAPLRSAGAAVLPPGMAQATSGPPGPGDAAPAGPGGVPSAGEAAGVQRGRDSPGRRPLRGVLKCPSARGIAGAGGGASGTSEGQGQQGKRVRWKDERPRWVIPQRRPEGDETAEGCLPPPPDARGPDARGRQGVRQQSYGGRPGLSGPSVPDHVLNPHKYTVYTFDEPVTVGSGGGAAEAAGTTADRANAQAAAEAMGLAGDEQTGQDSVDRFVPVTGSGIQFRPSSGGSRQPDGPSKHASGRAGVSAAGPMSLGGLMHEEGDSLMEDYHAAEPEGLAQGHASGSGCVHGTHPAAVGAVGMGAEHASGRGGRGAGVEPTAEPMQVSSMVDGRDGDVGQAQGQGGLAWDCGMQGGSELSRRATASGASFRRPEGRQRSFRARGPSSDS